MNRQAEPRASGLKIEALFPDADTDDFRGTLTAEVSGGGVAAVVLYPGAVATEFIQDSAAQTGMDLSQAQSTLFVGRAAAALLGADDLMSRSGTIQWVEDLAEEFDLYDEDGKRPPGYPRRNEATG